jgi:hypothetical protein
MGWQHNSERRTGKESDGIVVTYFNALSDHFRGETEKNLENLSHDSR